MTEDGYGWRIENCTFKDITAENSCRGFEMRNYLVLTNIYIWPEERDWNVRYLDFCRRLDAALTAAAAQRG